MRKIRSAAFAAALAFGLAGCSDAPDALSSASRSPTPPRATASDPLPTSASAAPTPTYHPFPASPMPSTTPAAGGTDYSLTFYVTGPSTDSNTVYTVWIEDGSGNNLQNLYVCNKMVTLIDPNPTDNALAGDALPNWLKDNYPEQTDIDGVTGASTQRSIVFSRDISTDAGAKRYIRLRFEIDRSWNDNDWFWDRPAFTYATELIDLEDLQDSYRIILSGWMSNGSTGESIGQQPKKPIPSFTPYLFMEEETYLAPYGDMVTAGKIVISEN